ncbi:MAG: hypothetical protein WC831_04075 [Parcubacteria group bacterium]|jgi:hypothetical protein
MKSLFQKISVLILLAAVLSFFAPAPARAGYWGEDLLAATYKQMLEEVYTQMKETMISNLKMVAIRTIQSRLSSLIGSAGSSGGSLIIPNWQNFVYNSASKYSTQVTKDFFSGLESGLPSAVTQRITSPAKDATLSNPFSVKPDIQNYVTNGDMSKVFTPGNAQNMWGAWRQGAKPQNDPAYYAMLGESLKQESARQKEAIKTAELEVGKGYQNVTKKASEAGGSNTGKYGTVGYGSEGEGTETIVTPASDVADASAKVRNMPIDMLAMADSIPQIATSMVTSTLTTLMKTGISTVSSQINKQLSGTGEIGSALSGVVGSMGSTATSVGGKTIKTTTGQLQNMIQSGLK